VVAVVVTHDAPIDRFDQVLHALAVQDHPNLDVLVVDTGTVDPTERVHAVLPAANVHRIGQAERSTAVGFGAAANVVLDLVAGAEFYVFCHDDAAPDPRAVSAMVAAAEQLEADIVGPKLVEWDDPHRFTQFGLTVDKVGVALPYVQRGELDQGQHDGLRDVFAVPGGFTLVRADRFAEIGGFDEAIDYLTDDLSLAWRARVAGARVVVTAEARVRHAEAFVDRPQGAAASRLAARHRVRVLLTSNRLPSLATVVPQALLLAMVEAIGALVTGRPGRARAALGAWPWNLWRLPSLVAARREVAQFRTVSDRDIRRYQVRGLVGPRLTLLRVGGDGRVGDGGRHGSGSRRVAAVPERGHMDVDPAAWSPGTVLVALALAAVVLFGSRHLLTRFVPAVGEMVPLGGGSRDLLGAWAGGWRPVGLGADAATPALAGAVGLLGTFLAGQADLARTLLTVGLLPLGMVGAHRLAGPLGSKRAQVAAAVAYAAVPLPYDSLASGRWSALGAYAAAPWMLARLARASGVMPFGPAADRQDSPLLPGGAGDDLVVPHRLWKHVVATGAVTGLAGILVPQAPLLLLLVGLGLAVGSLCAGEVRGVGRVLVAAVGGAVVAAVLLLPTTVDVLASGRVGEAWLGADRSAEGLHAADILGFDTGDIGIAGVAFAVLVAAAAPLLIGRRWRLGWAVRGWSVALSAWGVVWVHEQGWITSRMPDAGVVLAMGAAGLALAVALGVAAVEHDVRGRSWRFGLRRIVVAVGVLALVGSTASVLVASMDGWWDMPRDDFAGLLGRVDDDVAAGPSRVLWVGDPELLPGGDGWDLGDDLTYTASTAAAVPAVADLWPATGDGASPRLGEALQLAIDRDTTRLGRVLAPMSVQYVVAPRRLAPSGAAGGAAAAGATDQLVAVLAEQLDMALVRGTQGMTVYRNTAYVPLRTVVDGASGTALDETSVAALGGVDLTGSEPVLLGSEAPRSAGGIVPGPGTLVQASTASDQWTMNIDGRPADHSTAYGWADAFAVESGGEAELVYRTATGTRALVAAQALLWALALAVALRMRFGAGERPPAARLAGRRSTGGPPDGSTGASPSVEPALPSAPAVPVTARPRVPGGPGDPVPVPADVPTTASAPAPAAVALLERPDDTGEPDDVTEGADAFDPDAARVGEPEQAVEPEQTVEPDDADERQAVEPDDADEPAAAEEPEPDESEARDIEPELDESDEVDEPERRDPVPDYPRAITRPSGRVAAGRKTRR
jgi:GT2 family glycosyltransferase